VLWLYNVLLIILSPVILLVAWWLPELREGLADRLGRWKDRRRIEGLGDGKTIWLHGVSAGEVRLIKPLIAELKRRLPDAQYFATTITPAGRRVLDLFAAEESLVVSYFPLTDLPWVVARFVKAVRPRVFISTEAEAWPNLNYALKRRGVKRLLVNARIFAASKSALELKGVRWLLSGFDCVLCQSQQNADDFARIGVPREKLIVAGNIKSDFTIAPWTDAQAAEFRALHGWENARVLTAGSTHTGEDELVLDAFVALRAKHPEWVLALTPRHPERREEVAALCRQRGLEARLLTKGGNGAPVLIVDVMGALLDYYRASSLVILGGTFNARVGGHNILEPAHLAKPVICGPYIDSIADSVVLLRAADAVVETSADGLGKAVLALAEDETRRAELGVRAKKVAESLMGATKISVDAIMREMGS
jgi:3-deoxy-D-manno-octulosonic-acid transferase